MDLEGILSNPIRVRIMQCVQDRGEATTKQISELMPDIPAPTIYRHISYLLKEKVLTVKEEHRIRGSTERLLAIDEEVWTGGLESDLAGTAYVFLMSLYSRFKDHSKSGRDPKEDMLVLREVTMRLTDDRFASFLDEYRELLQRYMYLNEGGRMRRVAFVSVPEEEVSEDDM